MQKAFENERRHLKNELGEGDKFITALKEQVNVYGACHIHDIQSPHVIFII